VSRFKNSPPQPDEKRQPAPRQRTTLQKNQRGTVGSPRAAWHSIGGNTLGCEFARCLENQVSGKIIEVEDEGPVVAITTGISNLQGLLARPRTRCYTLSRLSRMPPPATTSKIVQFGVFELDLQRAELRKRGAKIKLQEQPLKVLQLLLESPGQIVSLTSVPAARTGTGSAQG